MSVITLRSIAVSTLVLCTAALSTATAQERQPVVTPGDEDDTEVVLAEPDFRVLNLPSTLRLPIRGSSFQLTHRFNGNLRQGSFDENAGNLFGLDQGAVVGFEYRFGVARHLQAAIYRTGLDKTFQFHGKYDAVRQGASIPVSLSALVSVEGLTTSRSKSAPAVTSFSSTSTTDRGRRSPSSRAAGSRTASISASTSPGNSSERIPRKATQQ